MTALRVLFPTLLVVLLAGCATAPTLPTPAESKALAVLASQADVHEKVGACRDLAVIGGPTSVPALTALLDHEQLADYARSGLEAINDPSAGKALRDALPKLEGRRLAGAVNSLGVRREKSTVPDLQSLAFDSKHGVSAEAVASLGMIGTADAAKVLQQILTNGPANLRVPAAHAALIAAEHLSKEGNPATARDLLDSIARANPSTHLAAVAQTQATALSRNDSVARE